MAGEERRIAFEIEGYVWDAYSDGASVEVVPTEVRFDGRNDYPIRNLILTGKYDLFARQGILAQGAGFRFTGYHDGSCEVFPVDDEREKVELPPDVLEMLTRLEEFQERAIAERNRRGV